MVRLQAAKSAPTSLTNVARASDSDGAVAPPIPGAGIRFATTPKLNS